MEFTYDGYNYWFCRGDSRYYRMNKKSYVIEEIPRYFFEQVKRVAEECFSWYSYTMRKGKAV